MFFWTLLQTLSKTTVKLFSCELHRKKKTWSGTVKSRDHNFFWNQLFNHGKLDLKGVKDIFQWYVFTIFFQSYVNGDDLRYGTSQGTYEYGTSLNTSRGVAKADFNDENMPKILLMGLRRFVHFAQFLILLTRKKEMN